jgi:pimeloyl-ACP methyl ester carboxylesterase
MGSKLGKTKSILGIEYDDVYWLDPIYFAFGIAKKLATDGSGDPAVKAVGVFLSVYLKLKLSLIIAGYDAEFYFYDWRLNVKGLGNDLKEYLGGLGAQASLVAHSMGGLVARAAIKAGADVTQLVMLGTPNYGSFVPVQALRGVDSTVKKLAALDLTANAEQLATIFTSFVGLCQMLPAQARYSRVNFFDVASWPSSGPQLSAAVLQEANDVQDSLADANEQFFLIAGYNQATLVGASLGADRTEFEYEMSQEGDGTVPLQFALLDNTKTVKKEKLDNCLKQIDSNGLNFTNLDKFGNAWAELVLPDSLRAVLPQYRDHHLVIVHDADSSRLPWETLALAQWEPALGGGVSHRYLADNLSVAKYLEQRRQQDSLDVLLIIDPTETLDGAKEEAERILKVFQSMPRIRVDKIEGARGTRQALMRAVSSGKYDVLHYAGHAQFDAENRSQSGILCAGEEVLSGADLSRLANLPSLVFFNACESARVRSLRKPKDKDKNVVTQRQRASALPRRSCAAAWLTLWALTGPWAMPLP